MGIEPHPDYGSEDYNYEDPPHEPEEDGEHSGDWEYSGDWGDNPDYWDSWLGCPPKIVKGTKS